MQRQVVSSQATFVSVGLVPGQKISEPEDKINTIPGWGTHDFFWIAEYKKANYVMIQLESSTCNHEFYQENVNQMSLYTSGLIGEN